MSAVEKKKFIKDREIILGSPISKPTSQTFLDQILGDTPSEDDIELSPEAVAGALRTLNVAVRSPGLKRLVAELGLAYRFDRYLLEASEVKNPKHHEFCREAIQQGGGDD